MKKKQVYLAGGMEKAKNGGRIWRENLTSPLEKLGWQVYNPCVKEWDVFAKHGYTPEKFYELKKSYKIDDYKKIFNDIVDYDLKLIDNSDLVIVYLDESVFMSSGTVSEMTFAHYKKIPVYVVLDVPKYRIPCWTIGTIDKFFNSFSELIEDLKK